MEDLNNFINEIDLTDNSRTPLRTANTFYSSIYKPLTKMHHILNHKIQKNGNYTKLLSENNRIKLKINHRRISKKIPKYLELKQYISKELKDER